MYLLMSNIHLHCYSGNDGGGAGDGTGSVKNNLKKANIITKNNNIVNDDLHDVQKKGP